MTIKPYLLPLLLTSSITAFAATKPLDKDQSHSLYKLPKDAFSHLSLSALASYTDFAFKSYSGNNYNIFRGYSKLISLGGNNVVLSPTLTAGVSILKSKTDLAAHVSIAPNSPSVISQSSRSSILFGHLMKAFKPNFLMDLAGAYSSNRVDTASIVNPGANGQLGFSANNSNNWFVSLSGLYSKPWQQFLVSTNARLLYSQVNTGSYPFYYTSVNSPVQTVSPLTNQAWYLMENLELGYKLQQHPEWTPFANTGLVQVLSYHNSRPTLGLTVIASSPQLDLNKNGVHFGAGFAYAHKQFSLRFEEQFYSAGRSYSSLTTLLGINYAIS